MRETTKIYKNSLIYSLGNFGSRILTFIMFPIYSYYLSTSQYGQYDLITAMMSLILPLLTLQIPESIMKFISEEKREVVIKTSLVMCTISIVVSGLIGTILSSILNCSFLILIWLELQLIQSYLLQITRALMKNKVYSFCSILSTFVMAISTLILLIKFNLGVNALIMGGIISVFCGIIYLAVKCDLIKWIIRKNFSKKLLRRMINFSVPLIPTAIIWWLMNSSDKYVINYFLGQSFNGIYAISYKFPTIITILYGFYNLAWQDHVLLSKDKVDYQTIFTQFAHFIVYISIVVMYGAKFVTLYMVNSAYKEAYLYIPPLIIGMIFYCFSGFWGIAYRKNNQTQKEMFTSVLGAVINVLINVALIKFIGLWAAALSTMISFIIVAYIRYQDTSTYFNLKQNYLKIFKTLFIYCIFMGIYYIDNFYIISFALVISIIIFGQKNRFMIRDIIAIFQLKR